MEEQAEKAETKVPAWKRVMSIAHPLYRGVSSVEAGLNIAGALLIFFLMLFTMGEVLGRYFFNRPILGHVELVELAMAGIIFLGLASTEKIGGHPKMEILLTRVLKERRIRYIVETLTLLLALFVFVVITIYSTEVSLLSAIRMADVTPSIFCPTWPSKLCIPLGSFFLCFRLVIEIVQRVSQVAVGAERREL